MPPAKKITKDMILEAGFSIVRQEGLSRLNVRSIAKKIGCSTQPVMSHYPAMDSLKAEICQKADQFHTECLFRIGEDCGNPMLEIGLNYIRFAHKEKNLFRLLFQSDAFGAVSFQELMSSSEADMLLAPLMEQTGLTTDKARTVFSTLFMCVHGIASLLANNNMNYDEGEIISSLNLVFMGAIGAIGGERDEEVI